MAGRLLSCVFAAAAASVALAACALGNPKCLSEDLPDPAAQDSNCDGIDGDVNAAIFVATAGNDTNPGTKEQPLRTVSAALTLAQKTPGKTQILMGSGDHTEPATLSLVGGYDPADWSQGAGKAGLSKNVGP